MAISSESDQFKNLEDLRARILGGGSLLLDQMSEAQLIAMQEMLFRGEGEIINSACKPYLIAKLD